MPAILREFQKFAMRGSLVDMAIGFTVGAAFTTVAKSAVNDLIMPLVGLATGGADFADLFFVMKAGESVSPPYETLDVAQQAGAVTLNYGVFINSIIAFLLVALVMFVIVRSFNRVEEQLEEEFGDDAARPDEPDHKKCPYCRTQIPYKAVKCPNCTSELVESVGIPL